MNPLYTAALEVQGFMQGRSWRSYIIGGLALLRWGRPRATQDGAITLVTGFGGEGEYAREILAYFPPRLTDAERFALENRVLLISASNGVRVDIALGALPFEEGIGARATPFEFAQGVRLVACSAEDLIVLKAFAGRPQDRLDVEDAIVRQGSRLDWDCIIKQLKPLAEAKGDPSIVTRLEDLRNRLG